MSRIATFVLSCSVVFFLVAPLAQADDWDGNGASPPNGVWGTGNNWVDNTTPGNADTAIFGLANTYTVTFNPPTNPLAIQALTVSSGNVTFASSGGPRTLAVNSGGGQDVIVSGATTVLTLGTSGNPLHFTVGDDLSMQGGGRLNIRFDSDVTASDFSASGVVGTLDVDGVGVSLTLNGAGLKLIARSGDGSLVVENGASASIAGGMAVTSTGATTGSASLLNGGTLSLPGDLTIASGNIAGQNGSVIINGASSALTQTGAVVTTVGSAANGSAAINIGTTATGGTLTTGTGGLMTINKTGTVTIGSAANTGTLNAGGNVTIDGGVLTRGDGSTFALSTGGTLAIQNGGRASFTGTYSTAPSAVYNITGLNAKLEMLGSGILTIGNDARINVSNGGLISGATSIDIGTLDDGTLSVDGAGSSVTGGEGSWGRTSGNTASVSFSNDATGTFSETIDMALTSSTTATLDISSGADVSIDRLNMATDDRPNSSATATVTGSGSTLTVGNLTLGSSDGTATVNVTNGGTLTQNAGTTFLNPTGKINIDGGTVVLSSISDSGGTINLIAGSLSYIGQLRVGASGLFGPNLTLRTNQTLTPSNMTTIDAGSGLTLDGGTLNTISLIVNGAFQFHHGTLAINGGTITGLSSMTIGSGGELRIRNLQTLAIVGVAGSTITATGNLTLGDATKVNGVYMNGNIQVGANNVTLADANDVVFDSAALVTLGDGVSPGTLLAANGLTLDFGGNLTGFGMVITPNSAAKPLINNGHVTGTSSAQRITLTGYVKGVGTLDNVTITGTDAPGFSPATVVRGSVIYDGTLEIEIGGTSPGSYDRIHHVLGAGAATLGGELDVELTGGFNPLVNNGFEIITASGGVSGTFDTPAEELPALSSGLQWGIYYTPNSVVLQVIPAGPLGDYNFNHVVDAADYTVWRNTLGQVGTGLAADGNRNGRIDTGDYTVWVAHYGATGGSGSAIDAAVPEPTALVMLATALLVMFARRRRAAE